MTLAVVILAAGKGTRMKSSLPKVLHPIGGLPMLGHVLHTAANLNPAEIVVVLPAQREEIEFFLQQTAQDMKITVKTAVQEETRGTGHAVLAGLGCVSATTKRVLILCADTPALTSQSLWRLCNFHQEEASWSMALFVMRPSCPGAYGRLVLGQDQKTVLKIVEAKNASEDQLALTLCNTGVLVADKGLLSSCLQEVQPDSQSQEIYLTDVVSLCQQKGMPSTYLMGEEEEFVGVNDRVQLAAAEALLQSRWRRKAMLGGVSMLDPSSVYLSFDTVIDQDAVIYPHVYFGVGVTVGPKAVIRSFSFLQNCMVEAQVQIGPCAHLRPGAILKKGSRIGNFVEVKNAVFESGAHADHLSYIGDSTIGRKVAIGAGTITCNYNGFEKLPTTIHEGAFIGSNTTLIAPVTVGENAIVAAGSVITKDVEPESLAFGRARQMEKKEGAKAFRQRGLSQSHKKRFSQD